MSEKEPAAIVREVMRIDANRQAVDMQRIDNRRFLYQPETGILVLGYQYQKTSLLVGSHADELAAAGITSGYDKFVRGWVGTGGDYPNGVIHFAPSAEENNIEQFNRAFDTLMMFSQNGAKPQTIVRGFGRQWEQPLSLILGPLMGRELKPSVRARLEIKPDNTKKARPLKKPQQER